MQTYTILAKQDRLVGTESRRCIYSNTLNILQLQGAERLAVPADTSKYCAHQGLPIKDTVWIAQITVDAQDARG
jgi:hypothetical protein